MITPDSIGGMANVVVVVGSLNVDLVVGLDRMPNPGETVFGRSFERHPGGKGLNQAVAAARLGAQVHMIGAVGDDDAGRWLRTVLAAERIDDSGVITVPGPSGTALIEVDASGANRIVVIPGANDQVTAEQVSTTLAQLGANTSIDVLLTQGEVPIAAVGAALEAARRIGARGILNPAPVRDYGDALLRQADILVPNEHEAEQICGMPTTNSVDADEAARALNGRGIATAVITRGSRGLVWASGGGSGTVPAFRVTPVDTVAAGDAFCGGLATALARGDSFHDALRFGAAAGALSTTVSGAVPSLPGLEQVNALLAAN
ncbi:MAG: ribokinase [Actinomycetales bacterium]|nr:ribokinase [Actinomycetales bacterium]